MTPNTANLVDISIFLGFLVVNLVVGLRYGRSIRTLRDYILGGRNFSTATLVATVVATWVTGRYLTARIAYIYQDGFFSIVLYLAEVGALVLIGWLFAMRMGPFLQSASIAEAMGNIYGRSVRIITAIFGLATSVGLASFQLENGEKLFSILLGWDGVYSTIIVGIIIIIYSAFGGVRAVTFTDIFQFFTFGTLLPILALAIWNDVRDFREVGNMIQQTPHWNIKQWLTSPESMSKWWSDLTFIPLYFIPAFAPAIFQRAIMAKDVYQIRKVFLYSSLIYFLITLLIIWIALLIRTQHANLSFHGVFPYIVDKYAVVGFRGLFLSGFTAMLMSTADSNLNAAASLLVNDIIAPLVNSSTNSLFKRLKSDNAQLILVRVGSIILGILALLLTLNPINRNPVSTAPVSMFWIMPWTMPWIMPWTFYMPVVSVPLLLTILGFRSTTRTVLLGMAAGFLTVYLWMHLLPYVTIDSSVLGMLVNFIVLMGGHYLFGEPGGWQVLDPTSPLALERAARRKAWRRRWNILRTFKLYPYLQKNLPVQESLYFFFGLYTLAATYVAFYTIGEVNEAAFETIYQGIYCVILLITTAFLTFPVWPRAVKSYRFVAYLWPIGIGGALFFTGTLLSIVSHFHPVQVMILMINFLMIVLLLHWPLALFLAFMGTSLAIFFFKQYSGEALPVSVSDLLQFRIIYGLLIFISFLIAFLKGKQAYRVLVKSNAQLSTENSFVSQLMLTMFRHRVAVLQEANDYPFRSLKEPVDTFHTDLSKEQLYVENEALHHYVYQLDTYNRYLKQVLHRTQHPVLLEVETIAPKVLWHEALEVIQQHRGSDTVTTQYQTACQQLQADPAKIQQLLTNALTYVTPWLRDKQPILIGFEDTQLAYPIMAMPGYIKHIKAMRVTITTEQVLPNLKKWYLGSVDYIETEWPQDIAALPITYNQQIVEAHYGFTETTFQKAGLTLIYVIPWDVREVKPPIMDQLQCPTIPEVLKSPSILPSEITFVKAVHAKTSMDTKLLQQAMQLIKRYHGENKHNNTGESCYLRAIAVAQIVLGYTHDPDTILAALMHNIIDKTHCSLQQIALYFGPTIQRIVDGVACVDSRLQSDKKLQLSHLENMKKLLETKDERILHVTLADRLHNLRMMEGNLPLAKQKKMVEETLQFFVPLATKLGLKLIAKELKERCFVLLR